MLFGTYQPQDISVCKEELYSQLFEYQFFNLGFIDILEIPSEETIKEKDNKKTIGE